MGKNLLKFHEDFIKNYDEDIDKGYILELDIKYPNNNLHFDLPILRERMEINKCNKLLCNLCDKNNYPVHTRMLKQALNHGLVLKKYTG